MIQYFRALFPRWNFFDQVAYSFEIEVLVSGSTRWQIIDFLQDRKWYHLVYNPNVNLLLAQVNVVEHFVIDLQEMPPAGKVDGLTTYKMLVALVACKIKSVIRQADSAQFKIVAQKSEEKIDLYVSDWIQLE